MTEQRLIEIETKLAHQERLLSDLDEALGSQQAQMTRLEELCLTLIERVRALAEPASTAAVSDERPPHY